VVGDDVVSLDDVRVVVAVDDVVGQGGSRFRLHFRK